MMCNRLKPACKRNELTRAAWVVWLKTGKHMSLALISLIARSCVSNGRKALRQVISVTLNVTWLLAADWLVWEFHNCCSAGIFPHNHLKGLQRISWEGGNMHCMAVFWVKMLALLMLEVRGQRRMVKLLHSITLNTVCKRAPAEDHSRCS